MPEGHLLHRFARDHDRALAGRTLHASSPQGRFVRQAARLDGGRLERVEAYGKHLFYWWEGGEVLHVHLGMQGTFLPLRPGAPVLPQSRLRLEGGEGGFDLVAPSACELVGSAGRDALVARLGPDPLRDDGDGNAVRSGVQRSRRPVGALLLDQSVLAGVGNVLRAEALFAAGIHPLRRGVDLSEEELSALWSGLVAMMRRAMGEGRIITVRPEGVAVADVGEQEGRYVYKQERCRRCGTPVQVWTLAGRTAYACPTDQPPPEGADVGVAGGNGTAAGASRTT